jgi:hypothetical protein
MPSSCLPNPATLNKMPNQLKQVFLSFLAYITLILRIYLLCPHSSPPTSLTVGVLWTVSRPMGQPNFSIYPTPSPLSLFPSFYALYRVDITRSLCPSISWPGFTLYIYLDISLFLPPPVFHLSHIFKSIVQERKEAGPVVLFDRSCIKLNSRKFSNKLVQAPSCERHKTSPRTMFLLFANYI